jgi:phosphatidate cytidylyltransferase
VTPRRILVGVLLAVVGLGSVLDATAFAVIVLIIALSSLRELARLTSRTGQELVLPVAVPAVALYVVLARLNLLHAWEEALLAATTVAALAVSLLGSRLGYLARSAYTVLGVLYLGKLLSYFVTLRDEPHIGAYITALAIVLIAMTDISCMIVGTTIGRTPLTSISPKKTAEGAIGGLLIVTLIGIAATFLPFARAPWWHGALVGAVTSLAAQAGDLVESALKRDAALKDTGTALFGHGGWLDRFDSYTFGGVAFYGMLHVLRYLPSSL